jgi:hypothetical protein
MDLSAEHTLEPNGAIGFGDDALFGVLRRETSRVRIQAKIFGSR